MVWLLGSGRLSCPVLSPVLRCRCSCAVHTCHKHAHLQLHQDALNKRAVAVVCAPFAATTDSDDSSHGVMCRRGGHHARLASLLVVAAAYACTALSSRCYLASWQGAPGEPVVSTTSLLPAPFAVQRAGGGWLSGWLAVARAGWMGCGRTCCCCAVHLDMLATRSQHSLPPHRPQRRAGETPHADHSHVDRYTRCCTGCTLYNVLPAAVAFCGCSRTRSLLSGCGCWGTLEVLVGHHMQYGVVDARSGCCACMPI